MSTTGSSSLRSGKMGKNSLEDRKMQKEDTGASTVHKPQQTSKPTTKAERRALQEAQRAAKAAKKAGIQGPGQPDKGPQENAAPRPAPQKTAPVLTRNQRPKEDSIIFKPLSHLRVFSSGLSLKVLEASATKNIHNKFRKFGEKLIIDELYNTNEKCRELLEAIATLVEDFKTPKDEDFSRAFLRILESHMTFLDSCRPLTVNMLNCSAYIRALLAQMVHMDESEARQTLISTARKYYEERILAARQSILENLTSKEHNLIANGDTIMIVGCSFSALEVVKHLIDRRIKFKLVMCHLDRISEDLINLLEERMQDCLHISLNDVVYLTNKVSKVIVPAMVLFANGNAIAASGYAQALEVMHRRGVSSIVLCETYKFADDATVNTVDRNELFSVQDISADGQFRKRPSSVQLKYDLINPSHITYLVCEKGVLPSTSSSAVSRLKFSDAPLIVS